MRSIAESRYETGGRTLGSRAFGFAVSPISISAVLFILAAAVAQSAPVLSTNLPPVSPALPDASFSVIRVFGAFVLVIGLFLGGVWLFRNWQRVGLNRGRPAHLQIQETRSLGGKHALYVVSYQNQRMLLAASPTGVTLVSHLPEDDTPASAPQAPMNGENFVQALQQAVQARA